ncbi:MAG: nucleoside 2-deoxyribosyltransferase [Candidatus Sumerlaeia bacterium]|nr:nucleoside 2-deoxyribosyltransferase [Candidatus Sumerlaeia bacterium]
MYTSTHVPDFTQLETTLRGGWAGRVPLLELGIAPTIKGEILGRPPTTVADEVAFMTQMGYDYVKLQPKIQFHFDRRHAQPGEKQDDRAWVTSSAVLLETMEDFQLYTWPDASGITYERLEMAREHLPDGMKVIGQYGDIFTTVWELMGFENFSVACYEDPDLIAALFQKVGDLVIGMYDIMAPMEHVGALWYSDDIAYTNGLMVSPEFLRSHFFPCLGRIGAIAARHGKPLLYHTDGVLHTVLEDIKGAGVNALHPIEPLAMDIVELKRQVGNDLCLCGNIDVDLLTRGTREQVRARVVERMEALHGGGGYCLGSSNSVPDYVRVENYLEMVTAATEYNDRMMG